MAALNTIINTTFLSSWINMLYANNCNCTEVPKRPFTVFCLFYILEQVQSFWFCLIFFNSLSFECNTGLMNTISVLWFCKNVQCLWYICPRGPTTNISAVHFNYVRMNTFERLTVFLLLLFFLYLSMNISIIMTPRMGKLKKNAHDWNTHAENKLRFHYLSKT